MTTDPKSETPIKMPISENWDGRTYFLDAGGRIVGEQEAIVLANNLWRELARCREELAAFKRAACCPDEQACKWRPAPSAASGLASQAEELCNVCEYPVSDPRCVHWGPYSKSEGLADEIEKILAEYHRAVELDEASLLPNIMSRWCDLFFKPGATAILAALRSHQAPVGEAQVREECAEICERVQHNFTGGAPDWQGGCIACAKAIRAHPPKDSNG